jgi:hypothetical protein
MSGDTNFDTMMETPNALRFVSASFASDDDESSEKKVRRRGGKNSKRNRGTAN